MSDEQLAQELVKVVQAEDFLGLHYLKSPYAAAGEARAWVDLFHWALANEVLQCGHNDAALAHNGQLLSPLGQWLAPGQARSGFDRGNTIFIRHSETIHPTLRRIAETFELFFQSPIDIQLYATPAGQEGFDWHYDPEDVFVFQSHGKKEFLLRPNTVIPNPREVHQPDPNDFLREKHAHQLRCTLYAGDWLYIPAGYWHKARAIEDSFHISVGVLNREAASNPEPNQHHNEAPVSYEEAFAF